LELRLVHFQEGTSHLGGDQQLREQKNQDTGLRRAAWQDAQDPREYKGMKIHRTFMDHVPSVTALVSSPSLFRKADHTEARSLSLQGVRVPNANVYTKIRRPVKRII
jgi:hypothetical protein